MPIILEIDQSGNLVVEAPASNGTRRKIAISMSELPLALREELADQENARRAKAKRDLKTQTRANIQETIKRHNDADFIKRVWGAAAYSAVRSIYKSVGLTDTELDQLQKAGKLNDVLPLHLWPRIAAATDKKAAGRKSKRDISYMTLKF